jgi:hypothetical protein
VDSEKAPINAQIEDFDARSFKALRRLQENGGAESQFVACAVRIDMSARKVFGIAHWVGAEPKGDELVFLDASDTSDGESLSLPIGPGAQELNRMGSRSRVFYCCGFEADLESDVGKMLSDTDFLADAAVQIRCQGDRVAEIGHIDFAVVEGNGAVSGSTIPLTTD